MNYKIIVAIFFITTTSFSAQSKECDCKGNFKWLTETFEKNDAGYNYILEEKGEETYQNHKRNISSRIKSITSKEECVEIMRDYLLYFRKAHFSISGGSNTITQGSNNTENSWKRISLTRDHVMNSTSHNKNGMDGIWKVGAYEIGILNDGHQYNGVILESSNKSWSKNDLKLTVNKDGTGVYYLGDFSPYRFDKAELIGVNTLKLGDFLSFQNLSSTE
ncbi:hypothetical protein [Chryseobacterium indoltheticum]|uniref:Uncharacterized protein n=1 Tax=Chryseobacterium indoltheticum TaxID=254 RepID=A0A381FQ78_9FLAO|nr:hypothetical protein [Chryseobacterium indoltheticum]SUX48769.1 Uncharacterised protein [Chryseobacterium indoltheticum]